MASFQEELEELFSDPDISTSSAASQLRRILDRYPKRVLPPVDVDGVAEGVRLRRGFEERWIRKVPVTQGEGVQGEEDEAVEQSEEDEVPVEQGEEDEAVEQSEEDAVEQSEEDEAPIEPGGEGDSDPEVVEDPWQWGDGTKPNATKPVVIVTYLSRWLAGDELGVGG